VKKRSFHILMYIILRPIISLATTLRTTCLRQAFLYWGLPFGSRSTTITQELFVTFTTITSENNWDLDLCIAKVPHSRKSDPELPCMLVIFLTILMSIIELAVLTTYWLKGKTAHCTRLPMMGVVTTRPAFIIIFIIIWMQTWNCIMSWVTAFYSLYLHDHESFSFRIYAPIVFIVAVGYIIM
jgi:hypothetical protein